MKVSIEEQPTPDNPTSSGQSDNSKLIIIKDKISKDASKLGALIGISEKELTKVAEVEGSEPTLEEINKKTNWTEVYLISSKWESYKFKSFSNLEKVILSHNGIREVSSDLFSGLVKLKTIDLSNNMINELSDEFFSNLSNLEVLNLRSNRIKSLDPNMFKNMLNIKQVDLSRNEIEIEQRHSDLFSGLVKLKTIDLSNNMINELSDGLFSNLSNLEVLNLGSNRIKSLNSKSFENLSKIREINLCNNKIKNVVKSLGYLDCIISNERRDKKLKLLVDISFNNIQLSLSQLQPLSDKIREMIKLVHMEHVDSSQEVFLNEAFKIGYNGDKKITFFHKMPDESSWLFSLWSGLNLSIEEIEKKWKNGMVYRSQLDLLIEGLTCSIPDNDNHKRSNSTSADLKPENKAKNVEQVFERLENLVFLRSLIDVIERKKDTITGLEVGDIELEHESFMILCKYGDEKIVQFFLNANARIQVKHMREYMRKVLELGFDNVALSLLNYVEKQDEYSVFDPIRIDYDKDTADNHTFDVSTYHPLLLIYQHQKLLENQIVKEFISLSWSWIPAALYFSDLVIYGSFILLFQQYAFGILLWGFVDGNVNIPLFKLTLGLALFYLFISSLNSFVNYFEYFLSSHNERHLAKKRPGSNLILDLFVYPTSLLLVYDDSMYFNSRSTLFSLTLIIGYISMILRFEEFPVIGVYVKVLRSVVKQSLKLLPLFVIIFLGFVAGFFCRSGYSDLKYNRSTETLNPNLHMSKFNQNNFILNSIILFSLLGGDIEPSELGLGKDIDGEIFGNYALVLLFMFLCILIFYNLFIGLATYAIDEHIKNSEYYSLQAKIYNVVVFEELAWKWYTFLKRCFSDNAWVVKYFKAHILSPSYEYSNKSVQGQQVQDKKLSYEQKKIVDQRSVYILSKVFTWPRVILVPLYSFYFFLIFLVFFSMSFGGVAGVGEIHYVQVVVLVAVYLIADVFAFLTLIELIVRFVKFISMICRSPNGSPTDKKTESKSQSYTSSTTINMN